jgi:hypothetical protein
MKVAEKETRMKHLDVRELVAGAILASLGLFVALYAMTHYEIGQTSHMGPGYFPVALGWILAGLGLTVAMFAFRKAVHVLHPPPFALRPLVAISASVAAFALLVTPLGLVPATFALVVIAAFAEPRFMLRRSVILGISLAIIAWLIFTVGLQVNLPAFARWS